LSSGVYCCHQVFTGNFLSKKGNNNSDKTKAEKWQTIGVKKVAVVIKYSQTGNTPEKNVRLFREFYTWNDLFEMSPKNAPQKTIGYRIKSFNFNMIGIHKSGYK